jgi:hypothetical protein
MVTDKRDPKRLAGALALPVSRIPKPWRPLYCALTHMGKHVGGDAQHALIWLAVHAGWPSGMVEVGSADWWPSAAWPTTPCERPFRS